MGGIPDPEASRDRLVAWKGRIDQLAADTQAMSDQMEQLRVTVMDPRRIVQVTVDSTGNLVDVLFSELIRRFTPEEVSQALMATIRAAKLQVADRSAEIIEATLGSDSSAGRAIADRVRKQLSPPDEAEGTA